MNAMDSFHSCISLLSWKQVRNYYKTAPPPPTIFFPMVSGSINSTENVLILRLKIPEPIMRLNEENDRTCFQCDSRCSLLLGFGEGDCLLALMESGVLSTSLYQTNIHPKKTKTEITSVRNINVHNINLISNIHNINVHS